LIQVQHFDYDDSLEAILRMFREDPEAFTSMEILINEGPEVDEYLEAWR
jgi:hypothetical protein